MLCADTPEDNERVFVAFARGVEIAVFVEDHSQVDDSVGSAALITSGEEQILGFAKCCIGLLWIAGA